jgi:hypothetical protein
MILSNLVLFDAAFAIDCTVGAAQSPCYATEGSCAGGYTEVNNPNFVPKSFYTDDTSGRYLTSCPYQP